MRIAFFVVLGLLFPAAGAGQLACADASPCNYLGHAALGFSVTAVAIQVGVNPEVATIAVASAFAAKEIRDHLKWKRGHDMRDSGFDLLSGVLGVFIGYFVFRGK